MKRAGIATGLGLMLIALITGRALGLKSRGNYIIRPGEKTIKEEPWKKIEDIARKTTRHGLIFLGDHIYIVTSGMLLYFLTRRKKNFNNMCQEWNNS